MTEEARGPIAEGERLPDVGVDLWTAEGGKRVTTGDFFAGKKIALFAVPGAFTLTCSEIHLPGFLVRADDIRAQGVDDVVCTAVNDVAVLGAWARATGATDHITMLADGNGDLARALGLELDGRGFGAGMRSRRYAAVVNDGVVEYLGVEFGREVGVSSAEAVLAALQATTGC